MQRAVGLNNIVCATRGALNRMHQPQLRINTDACLHAEAPLVTFLNLHNLRITLAAGVLCRTGRRNQPRIHHRATAQHQALVAQQIVDYPQNPRGQLVLLNQAAEPQNRRLTRQGSVQTQTCELAKERDVVKDIFHRPLAQVEPLLHEVYLPHRLHTERRAPPLAVWRVRLDQIHPIHLVRKFVLARSLVRQVQTHVD